MMIPTHHQTYNINTHQPPQQHQYLPPPGTLYTSPRAPQSIQLPPIQSFTKSQAVFPQSVRDSAPAANFNRYGSDSAGIYTIYSSVSPENLPQNTGQFQLNQQFINSPHFLAEPVRNVPNFTFPATTPTISKTEKVINFNSPMMDKKIMKNGPGKLQYKKQTSKVKKNDNKLFKVTSKPKTKKPKRNHSLIPNNSINFPIQIVSPNDILSVENNSFLNTVIYPNIEIKKYSTSAIDPQRNYLTAYEYPLNNHWVIWDYETGWVHLTGIWKASLTIDGSNVSPSHLKADIVKLLESTPKEYQQYIKRIRGGFLKIQGTWLPYKLCKILARRFCYYLRYSLIPIFGTDFPDSCLKPNEKGYGELKLDDLDSFEKRDLPAPIPPVSPPIEQMVQQPQQQQQHQFKQDDKAAAISSFQQMGSLLPLPQNYDNSAAAMNSENCLTSNTPETPIVHHFSDTASTRSTSSSSSSSSLSIMSGGRTASNASERESLEIPSFNEMIDIVNASKCLQTLSQKAQSPRSVPMDQPNSAQQLSKNQDMGISAILVAAGINSTLNQSSNISGLSQPINKGSMPISDMLT